MLQLTNQTHWLGEVVNMSETYLTDWRWRMILKDDHFYHAYVYVRSIEQARKTWLAHWGNDAPISKL